MESTMYGRARWLTPDELDEDQRAYYETLTSGPRGQAMLDEQGRLTGAFNARLLDPPVGTAIQELGAALRFGRRIDPRMRELVILETARAEQSSYEWNGHAKVALRAGMEPEALDAIRTGAASSLLSEQECVAREVAQALLRARDLDDDLFERAQAVLGASVIFDIVSLVGYYQNTAVALRVWRVPLGDRPPIDFHQS
jgi:4-carboxymuconolactone decarboxylase